MYFWESCEIWQEITNPLEWNIVCNGIELNFATSKDLSAEYTIEKCKSSAHEDFNEDSILQMKWVGGALHCNECQVEELLPYQMNDFALDVGSTFYKRNFECSTTQSKSFQYNITTDNLCIPLNVSMNQHHW